MKTAALVSLVLAATHGVRAELPEPAGDARIVPFSFQTDNGWMYDGRIEIPTKQTPRPWAVMLIGGGMGTTIDWLLDGIMTLDGKPTRDADTISSALLDRGLIVVRWEAIRRDDPRRAEDSLMIDVGPFMQTVEQGHKALQAFRGRHLVPRDHLFIVGHSLGAYRAAMLVAKNKKLPGVVMLAGARLIPSNLDAARDIIAKAKTGSPSRKRGGNRHERIIAELAAQRALWEKPVAGGQTKHGTPWPADVLLSNKTPTLLIVGSLDERWLVESYLFTDYMRRHEHPNYTWRVYEQLGHQLAVRKLGDVHHKGHGVISTSRSGPIDKAVVRELADWIDQRAK